MQELIWGALRGDVPLMDAARAVQQASLDSYASAGSGAPLSGPQLAGMLAPAAVAAHAAWRELGPEAAMQAAWRELQELQGAGGGQRGSRGGGSSGSARGGGSQAAGSGHRRGDGWREGQSAAAQAGPEAGDSTQRAQAGGGAHGATAPAPADAGAGISRGEGGCGGAGQEGMCCICLSERAVLGFVHADVVHCCLCGGCREELRRRGRLGTCPICKLPAAGVLRVVAT